MWKEEVRIATTGEQIVHRWIQGKPKRMPTNGYDYSALGAEVANGDKALVRYYPVPEDEAEGETILEDIKKVGVPTFMRATKDTGFTVIWIARRREDGRFRLSDWMDFRTFEYEMSDKIEKRFGFLGQATYWYEEYRKVAVIYDAEPEPEGYDLTVRILTEPKLGSKVVCDDLVDGVNIIRPRVLKDGIENMRKRLEAAGMDEDRINRIVAKHAWSKIHNGRLRLEFFLVKGDFVVARSNRAMKADITVFAPNAKPEIKAADGVVRFLMFPQVQHHERVKLNRQAMAHFFEALFDGVVEPHFVERIDEVIEMFRQGDVPDWMKEAVADNPEADYDAEMIQNYKDMISYFIQEVGSLNSSPAMLHMARRHLRMMLEPKPKLINEQWVVRDDDRPRKMFIPGARSVSIRSYAVYRLAGYRKRELKPGQSFLHRIGRVMEDSTYLAAMPILGGCDQDDHIDEMDRWALTDHIRIVHQFDDSRPTHIMVAKKHEAIVILYRNPIGARSNDEEIASEWFMVVDIDGPKEKDRCTMVDLNLMPKITAELKYGPARFNPRPKPVKDSYEEEDVWAKIAASINYVGAYGSHSNNRTAAAAHRYVYGDSTEETVFADECQQIQDEENMAYVMADNKAGKEWLAKRPLERCELQRLGIKNGIVMRGKFTRLAEFHAGQVERFDSYAITWANSRRSVMLERLSGYRAVQRPELLRKIDEATALGRQRAGTHRLDHEQYKKIGDFVVRKLDEAGWDESKWITETLRTLYYLHSKTDAGVGPYDTCLTNGALFIKLVAALKHLKAELSM